MSSPVVIPITLWNSSQPTFRISSICVSPNFEKVVTGSYEGQLCVWNFDRKRKEIVPKIILLGHERSVTCLVSTNSIAISSCDGGQMGRWNIKDGHCDKTKKSLNIHTNMQLFERSISKEELLFTCGQYTGIFIYNPVTLQVLCNLHSNTGYNWISNFHVVSTESNDMVSGVTVNGCAKFWVLDEVLSDEIPEMNSCHLAIDRVVDLKYNLSKTMVLIVSEKYWCLYDTKLSSCICKIDSVKNQKLLGGNFCNSYVIVWTNSGKFYSYDVSNNQQTLTSVISDASYPYSLFNPAMLVVQTENHEYYFLSGYSNGRINIWSQSAAADNLTSSSKVWLTTVLKDNWIKPGNGFFDSIITNSNVTCSIYVLELDKFFVGCFNGKIISIPALQTITSYYFSSTIIKPSYDIFSGHKGRINCLVYPYEKYSHYHPSHLVSGSSDFSVCLWDIFKSELLHRFCVQSGEILRLIIPPEDCSSRVRHSICSVSSDNSVAILNLKDRNCVILTLRHLFPVVSVNWKPLDDFLVIECFDGTVYVWQMETGHLDRVLDGVMAQEVVYACSESGFSNSSLLNFYIQENFIKKDSMRRDIFQVLNETENSKLPITLGGFKTSEQSESQIFMFNLENLIAQIISTQKLNMNDSVVHDNLYFLTRILSPDSFKQYATFLEKVKQETDSFHQKLSNQSSYKVYIPDKEADGSDVQSQTNSIPSLSETIGNIIQFLLSGLHFWGRDPIFDETLINQVGLAKPDIPFPLGVVSCPGMYGLFLPENEKHQLSNPSLITVTAVAITVLASVFDSFTIFPFSFVKENNNEGKDLWKKLFSFYECYCLNKNGMLEVPKPKLQVLAKSWQSQCLPLRNVVRKLLASYLEALDHEENVKILEFWYKYLPHFKMLDKTSTEKSDYENIDLKTVALVLFGVIGSDLKFKANELSCHENYVYQTCASFVYLLLLPNREKSKYSVLQTIAVDFIGRGYIVWEEFLKMEKVFPVLFQMCGDSFKINFQSNHIVTQPLDKCLTALNSLKSIAIARTSAFITCLIKEINQVKASNQSKLFPIEKSKPEILSIITFLLEKTPYIMLLYLNEIIAIFVYCIDFSHLKQENLSTLLPIMKKFRQVHHSVVGQRIAVGLGTGSVIVHDLKTGKSHAIPAHKDSVSAIKFSDDGKLLVSYSCYENRLSFWQVLTGLFSLGQLQIKCTKSCQTYRIHDEEIRNHLEIAQLTWADNKSVILRLCDGTETLFHS